jgi:tetratricopeptide (TPR) repeat protein
MQSLDFDMAAIVAKEANVEAILTGNISKNGDSLKISVKVLEPNQGKILKEESVEGKGLDAIFSMVDELSQKIKNTLALSLEKQEQAKGIADLSTNSLEAWRYYTDGVDLLQKAMFNEAIAQFEQAVEADPTFVAAYYRLCLLLFRQGERQKGYEYFEKLKSLKHKATPKEQFQIDQLDGWVNRDIRKVIAASQLWLKQNPNDVEAYFSLGDIYFGLQIYDEALNYYKVILNIDPKYKPAYNMIGYCYARKGDIANAIATMKQYQELAPEESNPFDSMGEIYFNYGEYKLAEKNLKKSIELNENFTGSWLQLGNIYLDEGEFEKATDIFHQYLEKVNDPTSKALGYERMGLAQWQQGKIDSAIDYFQRFVKNRVNSYRAATWVSELYLAKSDSANAMKSLEKNYDFIRDSIVVKEPIYIRDLANLSLWFDVNPDESINIIKQTLDVTKSPAVQMWGQFYLALLYLKTNQLAEYQKISENFILEFMEIMKDVRNVNFSNSTWKSFLIFNQCAYRSIDEGVDKYHQLIQYCRDHELTMPEMVFRLFLVDLYFHNGERGKAMEQLKIIGAPEEKLWMVIAPFDNTNGFNKKYLPEREIKLNKTYKDQNLVMKWQHTDDGFNEGYINLKQIYQRYNWKVAYGLIYVKSLDQKSAQIRIGTNESVKLWLNDEEVWRMNLGRDAIFDNDIIPVALKSGLNKILIKVCNLINEWGFYFRITDEAGKGVPDIEFISADSLN